jgi:hypothetical protein
VDIGAWIGVTSLVLAIPLGIASGLLTPRLVTYLQQRKLIKSHRTKEQDIAAYRSIEAFKNGTRDKYPPYLAMAVLSVNFAICGAVFVLLIALKYGSIDETTLLPSQLTIFFSLLAVLFFSFSALCLVLIPITDRRIQKFTEYTAEIRKKWGDDVV